MRLKKMFESVDKTVFFLASAIVFIFVVFIVGYTEIAGDVLDSVLGIVMDNLGWTYLVSSLFMFGFCLFLCFGKWGKIKLGKDDDKPEYGTISWLAMMFSAAMGVGLVFYGVSEPIVMAMNPPFGESMTPEGALEGFKMVFFQNGMSMWASYALFGIGLAYFNFRKGRPALLSYMLEPLIGRKRVEGTLGKVIDAAAIVSTVFGIAAALSICSNQLTAGFNLEFGLPKTSVVMNITIIAICIMYLCSAISGIEKGIKKLSNLNIILATILLIYMIITGPTTWILEAFVQITGAHLQDFLQLATYTDAFGLVENNAGYDLIGAYPVMYIAWFLAWTCFVGAFVAKVSKGRTIREVVFGVLIIPGIVSFLWFAAFGGTGIHMELFEGMNLSPIIVENQEMALFLILDKLPLGDIFAVVAIALIFTFFITTADSATFIASMYSSHGASKEPKTWVKLYWGIMIAVIAIVFWPIGGVQVCRQLSLIISIPIMIAAWALMASLLKCFKREKFTCQKNKEIQGSDSKESFLSDKESVKIETT